MLRRFFALALAIGIAGCDGTVDTDFAPEPVVSAFLGTDEPLPPVRLSRTIPLGEVYTPEGAALTGATVRVTLLAADGSDETVYAYDAGDAVGAYRALDEAATVLPQRTYRLDVALPDGETLTATTIVPPDFETLGGPPESVVYGDGNGPQITISSSTTPDRRAAFVAATRALAPFEFRRTVRDGEERFVSQITEDRFPPVPIVVRFLDCDPDELGLICDEDPTQAVTGSSPVINEASYIDLGGGELLVEVPYLAFGFFGPTELTLVSLDAAMQDFVETQAIQGGGSTLSPGEIPNVTTNVEGGLGVFGSYSREFAETLLLPPAP